MSKKQILFLALATVTAFGFQSCRKKGCTDSMATNYDDEAKKDDGSCEYRGEVIFWFTPATEDSLAQLGYSSYDLTFLVNGTMVTDDFGSAEYWFDGTVAAPECSSGGFWGFPSPNPVYDFDMGSQNTSTITYSVVDPDGDELFGGTAGVQGGACTPVQVGF